MANPAGIDGKDGIHLWGGSRLHVMSNIILAGDDAVAAASSPNSNLTAGRPQTIHNRNVEDVEVFNNRLVSHGGRTFFAGLANTVFGDRDGDQVAAEIFPRMTNVVQNIRVRNFTGESGGVNQMLNLVCAPATSRDVDQIWPYTISDPLVPAQVRNIKIQNADIRGSDQLSITHRRPPVGIRLRSDDVGSFYNILIDNIRVRNVEPDIRNDVVFQRSKIFAVEKAIWYGDSMSDAPVYGHDNELIVVRNCNFEAQSLNNNNTPDGGDDAEFLYFIDGELITEINDLENNLFNNSLNLFSAGDPGIRLVSPNRHTGNTNN